MHDIEKIIGYKFRRPEIIKECLKHPSAGGSLFDMLEFLGDRVLGLAVAEMLYSQADGIRKTASKFANLVSSSILSEIAEKWNMKTILVHGIDDDLSSKVLADACEAVLGGVFVDSSYQNCANIIKKWWEPYIETVSGIDPKMQLQEISQGKRKGVPIYELISAEGPPHAPRFRISVSIENLGTAFGEGNSKQEASKNAAIALLKKLMREV